ncbi:hypothetical protein ACVWYO_004903 [Sphingomonas sp. UYP23]
MEMYVAAIARLNGMATDDAGVDLRLKVALSVAATCSCVEHGRGLRRLLSQNAWR